MDAARLIEALLDYAREHLHASVRDRKYLRNRLLDLFRMEQTEMPALQNDVPYTPDRLFNATKEYGESLGQNGDRFATEAMGILTPMPSAVESRFLETERLRGITAACDEFYAQCIASNYVRMSAIAKNIKWTTDDEIPLEITINLSKPEKSNREIAAAAKKQSDESVRYPTCLLCAENEGYAGTDTHPPRANLRTIGLKLDGEDWFMQYSPYLYFNEHCIVIKEDHSPMTVDSRTPRCLIDFVERFPSYFLGSNAALPIVGGSILTHEHFQGGRHTMPMHRAAVKKWIPFLRGVGIGVVDWYASVVRVSGRDPRRVADAAGQVIETWKTFQAPEVGIVCRSGDTPHNAAAPIARKSGSDFTVDLILRNNRTDENYPDGIFHAHPEHHHIKKEAIGLIESMGLFILPGRLNEELRQIQILVQSRDQARIDAVSESGHPLNAHAAFLKRLVEEVGSGEAFEVVSAIRQYVNETCKQILTDTAVFKNTREGLNAFDNFLRACNVRIPV